MNTKSWQKQALALDATGTMSRRSVAEMVGVARSTVLDFLRGYEEFKTEPEKPVTHLFLPDDQVKPGIDMSYLSWKGEYIAKKRPDVIICGGDWADMTSLSSFDKGKRRAEGKRVKDDIDAAIAGMKLLLQPMRDLQAQQRAAKEVVYEPRMVLLLGNHEHRIDRHVEENPELYGFLSVDDLLYEEFGWEVVPFLTPIVIDGISYCHYFPNVMNGKPLGGNAATLLKTLGTSYTCGHKQTLDVATRFLQTTGQQQWGLTCGAGYPHEEHYKGFQGNFHWRGIVLKHRVKNGSYDPLFISLDWLKSEYGK
jgi:hypothetical protein